MVEQDEALGAGAACRMHLSEKRRGVRLKRAWARKSGVLPFGFTEHSALLSQLGLWNCSQDLRAKRFGVCHLLRRLSLSWHFRQASQPGPGQSSADMFYLAHAACFATGFWAQAKHPALSPLELRPSL